MKQEEQTLGLYPAALFPGPPVPFGGPVLPSGIAFLWPEDTPSHVLQRGAAGEPVSVFVCLENSPALQF